MVCWGKGNVMLSPDQWELIIESLQQSAAILRASTHKSYPIEEFCREQLERVEETIQAARRSRKKLEEDKRSR